MIPGGLIRCPVCKAPKGVVCVRISNSASLIGTFTKGQPLPRSHPRRVTQARGEQVTIDRLVKLEALALVVREAIDGLPYHPWIPGGETIEPVIKALLALNPNGVNRYDVNLQLWKAKHE